MVLGFEPFYYSDLTPGSAIRPTLHSVPAPLCFLVWQDSARSCLAFLVAQLGSTEHSCHHILLLEIKRLTDTFTAILGPHRQDIFRPCNSFTAIAKLLVQQLNTDRTQGGR